MYSDRSMDISSWRPFEMSKLFKIVSGSRLRKQDMKDGDINYIGASAFNNGVTAKIGNTENLHPAGTITVCYNGSIGKAFYQTETFWATDDVNVLYPLFDLTPDIAQFLIPIIQKISQNYAYIDKWTGVKMLSTEIPLPCNSEGEPDWTYMESYVKNLKVKAKASVDALLNVTRGGCKYLNISQWKEFRVGDLFPDIIKPKVYHSHDLDESLQGIPYVVRSKFNNGIKFRVKERKTIQCNPAGVISFGAENSSFFFQKEKWCSGRDIYYLDTRHISPYACLFLCSCLQTISSKYAYNYGLFPELLKEEVVKLPVTENGAPDWQFMESYVTERINISRRVSALLRRV